MAQLLQSVFFETWFPIAPSFLEANRLAANSTALQLVHVVHKRKNPTCAIYEPNRTRKKDMILGKDHSEGNTHLLNLQVSLRRPLPALAMKPALSPTPSWLARKGNHATPNTAVEKVVQTSKSSITISILPVSKDRKFAELIWTANGSCQWVSASQPKN